MIFTVTIGHVILSAAKDLIVGYKIFLGQRDPSLRSG
jgi:hypothetical protein